MLPCFLWRYPFAVTVGSVVLDAFDVEFFRLATNSTNSDLYQVLDKSLDFYWYLFAFIYSLFTPYWFIFAILFSIRLIGMIAFLLSKDRRVFLLFPNIFENFFVFYVAVETLPQLSHLLNYPAILWVSAFLIVIKLFQEYLVHIAGFSLHRTIFGVPLRD
ncbi:MAG: hypothetical protein U9M98_00950 [Patescibacteria group bacterium]|nr:hypothetical protein [Patescibacteria group bacterium]